MKLQDIYPSSQGYEKAKFRLKTITPIHIGGRAEIGSNRLLITQGVRAIVDEEKLFNRFYQEGVVDDYLDDVSGGQSGLFGFLNGRNWFTRYPNNATIDAFARGVAAYQLDWYRGIPSGRPSSIRPFIREGEHKAYIPGTSIKGATRTAVLCGQLVDLQNNPHGRIHFDNLISAIRRRVSDFRPSRDRPALDSDDAIRLIEQILQDFDIEAPDGLLSTGERSLFDLLKALLVSDTTPAEGNLNLCRVQMVSEGGTGGWHFSVKRSGDAISIYAEVLPENLTFNCDVTFDKFTAGRFIARTPLAQPCLTNLSLVLGYLGRFSANLLAFERGYFDYIYNLHHDTAIKVALDEYERIIEEKPNIRIGWGSGLTGITILTLLEQPDAYAIRDHIFDTGGFYDGIASFPKTRRFIVLENRGESGCTTAFKGNHDLATPLGWCRLEQEGGSE